MARCGCASDRCSCHFIAGENIILSGTGTRSNPYVIQAVSDPNTGGGGETGGTVARLTGEITAFGGQAAPGGWLLCDGSVVDRGAFPDLFAVIGTAYGAGDGVTTFRLPDLNGKVPLGASASRPRGTSGGAESQTLTMAHLPSHSHGMAHNHSIAHTHSMSHTHSINHDHDTIVETGYHTHDYQAKIDASGLGSNTNVAAVPGGVAGTLVWNQTRVSQGQHSHDIPNYVGTSGGASTSTTGAASNSTSGDSSKATTDPAGSASTTPLDLMPPYTSVIYIIKT